MPSATPDAEIPVYRIEHTMPDLRIPAAYRANAAADTADLPIITPDGDRDDPGEQVPRRASSGDATGAPGRCRSCPGRSATGGSPWAGWPSSSPSRHGWPTWSPGSSTTSSTRATRTRWPGPRQVLYLLIVTMLTVSALAYLLARLGFFYRTRTHHRASRAILDQFYDTPTPTLTTIIPSYQEDARVIRNTLLSAALQEYPGQAGRPADRRPVRARRTGRPASSSRPPGRCRADRAAAGRARHPVRPRAAVVRAGLRARRAARRRADDRAGRATTRTRSTWLEYLAADQEIVDHTDAFFGQRGHPAAGRVAA